MAVEKGPGSIRYKLWKSDEETLHPSPVPEAASLVQWCRIVSGSALPFSQCWLCFTALQMMQVETHLEQGEQWTKYCYSPTRWSELYWMHIGWRNTLLRHTGSFLNWPQYINDLHACISPRIVAEYGLHINGKVIIIGLLGSWVGSFLKENLILVRLDNIHIYYRAE